ncbi:zf-HC2 domain-containing protein [Streptomyces argyrophyllae]|uniref:Zf-HC2 domain-containing protein n=1 Tax=Streptomyces argyrophylli TaxID=2726118 RepID=A0A6M4PQK8_9ACTN|nr:MULTISPECIES: zf-HC2 domain-containing protein [Streptomyces]QJS12924.1 zf-HC2 domain-containing protein [Streptomyces argyrophyllae]
MSGDANCEKLRELGAELALGVLPGRERAEAVAHLDRCADCREYVRQLTLVGDRLAGLLPDREPPPGFDTRVARGLVRSAAAEGQRPAGPLGRPRRGPRHEARRARVRVAAVGAALAVAVGFAGWAVGTAVEEVTASPPPAVESEPVLVGDMTPAGRGGQSAGEVYAHPGTPGWMFLTVALTRPGTRYTGRVTCFLERADGTSVRVGDFPVRDGHGAWGVAVPVDLTRYSGARLTSPDGTVLATAQLREAKVVTPTT